MSVRQGLLALLMQRACYGAQLQSEFQDRTGGIWSLNIGQVYTTLNRLGRDGLVERGSEDSQGRVLYWLTNRGYSEIEIWFTKPVVRGMPIRDELTIKIALAVGRAEVDIHQLIYRQRAVIAQTVQDYIKGIQTRLHDNPNDLAAQLVLESQVYAAEAQIRWLDHCVDKLSDSPTDVLKKDLGVASH